jgi:branched-chain amino acid transport system substrate-binding protein
MFKKILAVCFAFLLASSAIGAETVGRVALVIGNAAYKSSPLANPVNDAQDMAKSLRALGFDVVERTNITSKQIGRTLRAFRTKIKPGDVALVFYAGHGLQINGENYLPAVDADIVGEEDVPNQSLSTRQIMDVLAESKSSMNLVFLDACRDNPYARSFRSATRGLSRENAPSGTLISYATRPGSVAADGTGRNGLYTSVLLKAMEEKTQPIEQVLKQVVRGVTAASNGTQEPWMEGSLVGDFCFGNCLLRIPNTVNTNRDEDGNAELIFWKSIESIGKAEGYKNYLNRYPKGLFSDLARLRLTDFSITVSTDGKTTRRIVIGHAAPTTGAISHLGQDNERGARLAIKELNAANIRIGGERATFHLLAVDDAADPKQATVVAQKLVDAKVNGIVGHLSSGTTIPASWIYSDAGVPQISPSATNPKYTRQGFDTTFRLVADDYQLGKRFAHFAVETLKGKNVAIVDDRTAYGEVVASAFEEGVRAAGGKVVAYEYTDDSATGLGTTLTSIARKSPDILFFGGMDNVAGQILQQMQTLDMKAKLLGGDGICTVGLSSFAGDSLKNELVYCAESAPLPYASPSLKKFRTEFNTEFGSDFIAYAPYAYDAVKLMVDSMKRAESADPKVYVYELQRTVNYEGVTGSITFDKRGDVKNAPLTVYTYQDGRRKAMSILN